MGLSGSMKICYKWYADAGCGLWDEGERNQLGTGERLSIPNWEEIEFNDIGDRLDGSFGMFRFV